MLTWLLLPSLLSPYLSPPTSSLSLALVLPKVLAGFLEAVLLAAAAQSSQNDWEPLLEGGACDKGWVLCWVWLRCAAEGVVLSHWELCVWRDDDDDDDAILLHEEA